MNARFLGIYLDDHLAGATAGLELARRSSRPHPPTSHPVCPLEPGWAADPTPEVFAAWWA